MNLLELHCKAMNLPAPVPEFRFHPTRRWKIDFAWPDWRLAVEIEGGLYGRGRHVSIKGFKKDIEKYNTLAVMGWKLLRFLPEQVKSGEAVRTIEECFIARSKEA
jgi:very-short-patch-repair endonuclease